MTLFYIWDFKLLSITSFCVINFINTYFLQWDYFFQYHVFDFSSFYCFYIVFDSFFFISNSHKVFTTNFIIFIGASDILLSMLFNLVPTIIANLLCFSFLFRVVFNYFFTTPVAIAKQNWNLYFFIPTGAPKTVAKNVKDILSLTADKTFKDLSK